MVKKLTLSAVVFASILSLAMFCGCNVVSSGSAPHGTTSYVGTQSPGDVWTWVLGEGTFTASNEDEGVGYSGTFSTLSSGFIKCVVTSSTDPAVSADGSAIFYMLEYPDTMLMVKPNLSNDRLIVCASIATSAPPAGRFNWVKVPERAWDMTSSTSYGTGELVSSGGTFDVTLNKYKLDGTLKETTVESGAVFSSGRFSRPGGALQVFVTASGFFVGDNGHKSGGFAGVTLETVDMSAATAKSYRGFLFSYDAAAARGEIKAVGCEPSGTSRTLNSWSYSNIETGAVDTSSNGKIAFGPADGTGVITANLTKADGTSKTIKMVAAAVGGKYIIAGIDASSTSQPDNFFLVQQ